MGLWARNM